MGTLGITSGEEVRVFLRAGSAPLRVLDVQSNPLCSPPSPYGGAKDQTAQVLAVG
jgi:hypothetical protein